MKRFRRVLWASLLLLSAATGVNAQSYVTEIYLSESSSESGWTSTNYDLNKGVGGKDIFLHYKTSSTANPETGYITDIMCSEYSYYSFPYDGRMYYQCGHSSGLNGDLNQGCSGSKDIFLYYTTSHANLGAQVLTGFTILVNSSNGNCAQWKSGETYSGATDVNEDAGGDYIYIQMNKASQSVRFNSNPVAATRTYNTSAQDLLTSGGSCNGGTIYYRAYVNNSWTDWSTSWPMATNAGSYSVQSYVNGGSFANNSDAVSLTATINPKTINGSDATLSQTVYTYTGSAITPTVTLKDGTYTVPSSEYTVTYYNNVNALTGAYARLTDNANGNYTVNQGDKQFTINKATPSITTDPTQAKDAEAPDNNSLLYTGSDRQLVTAGVAGGVTGTTNTTHGNKMQYKLGDGDWSDNVPEATAIGDYTIYYKVKGDANHIDLEDAAYKIENHIVGYKLADVEGKGYATYFRNDNKLRLSDASAPNASIYTVKKVEGDAVELTEPITVVPSGLPVLVYNTTDADADIYLVPTKNDADEVTAAEVFKGTASAKDFTDNDMTGYDFYVLNGDDFVWVRDAGTIAANRCWLEFEKQDIPYSARHIVMNGETTGIRAVVGAQSTADSYYDLNGRKLTGMPTQKGVYIFNGRKVVK